MFPPSAHELLRGERWRSLTADQEKLRAYADDEWVKSGLDHAYEVLGDDTSRLVQRHAVLVIQPDCIARRTALRCVELVRCHGFAPVHTIRFHFGTEQTAGIWHYQSNVSTQDSLDIADQVCGKGDSLLLLLRDTTPEPKMPASLRLTDLKGRSNPAKRTEHHLRSILGGRPPFSSARSRASSTPRWHNQFRTTPSTASQLTFRTCTPRPLHTTWISKPPGTG